jgi:hypothetical protein
MPQCTPTQHNNKVKLKLKEKQTTKKLNQKKPKRTISFKKGFPGIKATW